MSYPTLDPHEEAGYDEPECEGHPAGPFDPMGVTVYCDGTCQHDDEPPDPIEPPDEDERFNLRPLRGFIDLPEGVPWSPGL